MSATSRRLRSSLALAGLATVMVLVASIMVGPTDVTFAVALDVLTAYDPELDAHLVVREIRLPRAVVALLVGGSLAAAGAVMQGVTRNPLAGPSLMGLSGGAALAGLVALAAIPGLGYTGSVVASLMGATLGYAFVLAIAALSRDGFSPTRLTLAGVAASAFFSALTQALIITLEMSNRMLYWTAGGIANVTWDQVTVVLPFLAAGLAGALWLAPAVTILNLGRDTAVGLGQRTTAVRLAATACILLLTGSSVAIAGPVAFVGLMTPHLCRLLVGTDYRRVVPLSILAGAALTGLADLGARALVSPRHELPLGVVTALVGAPCFLWLVRDRWRGRLDGGAPSAGHRRTPGPARNRILVIAGVFLVTVLVAVHVGRLDLSPWDVARTAMGRGSPAESLVLWSFRFPRIALGVLVGAGIGVSGTLVQGVLRNDLAEPGLLGVSAGAGLAITSLLWLLGTAVLGSTVLVPAAALLGALAATALVALIARGTSRSSPQLVLAGVAVSAVLGAATLLVSLQMSDDAHAFAVAWSAGSLNTADWADVAGLGVWLGLLVPLAWSLAPTLDVLRLGDDAATGLGVLVGRALLVVLGASVAIASACMALGGGILFLGLLAPHIARLLVGTRHADLIPAVALVGATLLVVADVVGSRLLPETELPAGTMVCALGAPYFLYLLARS